MSRKRVIKSFIQEMEDKYKPDDKRKSLMRNMVYRLLDNNISDENFEKLLQDAEKSYQRIYELAKTRQTCQNGLLKIKQNLEQIADMVQKQSEGINTILSYLTTINRTVERLGALSKRMEEASVKACKNSQLVSKNLKIIIENCKQTSEHLSYIELLNMPPKGNA